MLVQSRVVSLDTMYTQTTKTDSVGCVNIWLYMCITILAKEKRLSALESRSRFEKTGEEGFTVSLGSYNNRLPRSNSRATAFFPEEDRQSPTFQAFGV